MSFFEDLFLKKGNDVSDTKSFVDVGLWYMDESEYFRVITQRTKGNIQQYYLFDFLKIWQKRIKEKS